eukprot:gene37997-59647_t
MPPIPKTASPTEPPCMMWLCEVQRPLYPSAPPGDWPPSVDSNAKAASGRP